MNLLLRQVWVRMRCLMCIGHQLHNATRLRFGMRPVLLVQERRLEIATAKAMEEGTS